MFLLTASPNQPLLCSLDTVKEASAGDWECLFSVRVWVSSIFYLDVDCSFLTPWEWGGLVAFPHSTAANKTHGKARSGVNLDGQLKMGIIQSCAGWNLLLCLFSLFLASSTSSQHNSLYNNLHLHSFPMGHKDLRGKILPIYKIYRIYAIYYLYVIISQLFE